MSLKKWPSLALLMLITLGFMSLLAPGIRASDTKTCSGNDLITTGAIEIDGVWLNTTISETCANGCYDNMNYLGAGCAPSEFEIVVYTIVIVLAFLAAFYGIGRMRK